MEYTTNYHLPQWVESDRIMMGDFNQMCSDIEIGLTTTKAAADAAKGTADSAYSPVNKPYAIGSYIGNGSDTTITLGFRPSFLIISGSQSTVQTGVDSLGGYEVFSSGNILTDAVTITDTGFITHVLKNSYYPRLAESGRRYDYIAFR